MSRAGEARYWDASAVISLLIADAHTAEARRRQHRDSTHLLSSLTLAETAAVLRRLADLEEIAPATATQLFDTLRQRPWQLVQLQPTHATLAGLSRMASVRGADLWHLALWSELRSELPELELVTFDRRLAAAAAALNAPSA